MARWYSAGLAFNKIHRRSEAPPLRTRKLHIHVRAWLSGILLSDPSFDAVVGALQEPVAPGLLLPCCGDVETRIVHNSDALFAHGVVECVAAGVVSWWAWRGGGLVDVVGWWEWWVGGVSWGGGGGELK